MSARPLSYDEIKDVRALLNAPVPIGADRLRAVAERLLFSLEHEKADHYASCKRWIASERALMKAIGKARRLLRVAGVAPRGDPITTAVCRALDWRNR